MLVEGGPPIGRLATARALHDAGPRRAQPFIELRVRDAPETLLEPTLFGVLTGVMTGRHNDRPGYLELAAGGTLLLEGLEGVPAFVQRKLVRMLEERRFQQVQTGVWIPLAARLIVGTEAIAAGPLGDRLRARTLHLAG
jgi:DNA-binding NtrC family response regulator